MSVQRRVWISRSVRGQWPLAHLPEGDRCVRLLEPDSRPKYGATRGPRRVCVVHAPPTVNTAYRGQTKPEAKVVKCAAGDLRNNI